MPAFTGSADFQEDAHGNTVEEGEAEACTEAHRKAVRSRSRGLPVENVVQGLPAELGEEIPSLREKGLERKKRKRTSEADKEVAVRRCLSGERNKDLAEEYGVSCGAVSNWCRSYSQSGRNMVKSIGERKPSPMREKYKVGSAEFEKLPAKEQIKILKEELEYARTENAVLKKLRALGEQEEAAREKRR